MFRRVLNTAMAALARRGRGPAWELTVTGRRSGEPRTVPVTPIEVDGSRYLVAPYGAVGWVHNIRAAGRATLRRGSSVDEIAVAEVDGPEAGAVLMAYHADLERIVGNYFDLPAGPALDDFTAVASDHPVFRIE
jgi:deazaflavin-dependent oxidoreductase (nitroreductase family)